MLLFRGEQRVWKVMTQVFLCSVPALSTHSVQVFERACRTIKQGNAEPGYWSVGTCVVSECRRMRPFLVGVALCSLPRGEGLCSTTYLCLTQGTTLAWPWHSSEMVLYNLTSAVALAGVLGRVFEVRKDPVVLLRSSRYVSIHAPGLISQPPASAARCWLLK